MAELNILADAEGREAGNIHFLKFCRRPDERALAQLCPYNELDQMREFDLWTQAFLRVYDEEDERPEEPELDSLEWAG